jgi:hypothetical protein
MIHLLLFKYGSCQDDALAALFDSCSQEQCAQVLFHRAGADIEFRADFFIAAALHQQLQYLLIAARDFDVVEIKHNDCLL